MNFRHNKKRNVGLLSEFFSLSISNAVVQKDEETVDKAINLWKKSFAPGTELHKEFLAFKALHEARLKDKTVADRLLQQVKTFVKQQNPRRLEEEKTTLIKEVNFALKDSGFWNRNVTDYKVCATIQVLFSHWRGQNLLETIQNVYHLEDTVLDWMTQDKPVPQGNPQMLSLTESDISGLVFDLMTEKFNKKYAGFTTEQKNILRYYLSPNPTHQRKLQETLKAISESVERCVSHASGSEDVKAPLLEKVESIASAAREYDLHHPTDEAIGFFLAAAKFEKEFLT